MKQCSTCKQLKPESEFSKDKKTADGLRSQCKECHKQCKEQWKTENPEQYLWAKAKNRAKTSGLEFNIEVSDIVIPEFCPVLGLKLEKGEGRQQDNSPTLDRIDSSKGYVKGNIEVISWRANSLKKDATPEELQKLATYYKRTAA